MEQVFLEWSCAFAGWIHGIFNENINTAPLNNGNRLKPPLKALADFYCHDGLNSQR